MAGYDGRLPRTANALRKAYAGAAAGLVLYLFWPAMPVSGHDLIDAQSAERFLAEVDNSLVTIKSKVSPSRRAQANISLGRNLDEIRELLNRDIASHGKPQGLPTLYLVKALQERGISLQVDPRLQRIPARQAEYREALRLDPNGSASEQARFRLLTGYFYDSFDADPLAPRAQDWERLQAQIELGETYLANAPRDANSEEAQFILTVHYLQAATSAQDASSRARFTDKARRATQGFKAQHPDSMRLPALEALSERLGPAR